MDKNGLKFKSMSIDQDSYGANKGKLIAKVRCERWDTKLEIVLPDDIVLEMMKLISPVIAAQVHRALIDVEREHEDWMISNDLKQPVIEAVKDMVDETLPQDVVPETEKAIDVDVEEGLDDNIA